MNVQADERTDAIAKRSFARAFHVIGILLSVDLLVRVLILKQPLRYWVDILVIILMAETWAAWRTIAECGPNPILKPLSRELPDALIATVIWGLVMLISHHGISAGFVTDFAAGAAGIFIGTVLFRGLYRMWMNRARAGLPPED